MSLQKPLVHYGAMLEPSKEKPKVASGQVSVSSQWMQCHLHTLSFGSQAADLTCFGLLRHRQINFDEGPQSIAFIFMTQA